MAKQTQIFMARPDMYSFEYLPAFAAFILQHHLEEFVEEQIRIGYDLRVPLVTTLRDRYSDEEIVRFSMESNREFLEFLAAGKAAEQIEVSMQRWMSDELEVVGKFQVKAQDITLVSHLRQQGFKKLIPYYTQDITKALSLSSEIDLLHLGSNTTAIAYFFELFSQKIHDESNLSHKLIEASPAITFVQDVSSNRQLFISGKIKDVLGYEAEDLNVAHRSILSTFTHPEDLPTVEAHIKALNSAKTNDLSPVEYRFKHKDGTFRWLRSYLVVLKRDERGQAVELLGKTFEVTHEKETALALQKREAQLLEAQAIAHLGSYEWDIMSNNSTNTPEVFRIFEMEADQKFEEFISYVHNDDVEKVKAALEQSFITGVYECEYRYIKRGREKVILSIGRVEFEFGSPARMLGTVQDVTDIKRIERALKQKTAELEQSNQSLQQFAFVASHDLKEPLRKISMFTDLIASVDRDRLSEGSLNYLQKVQRSSESMRRMVEDILSFSLLDQQEDAAMTSLQDLVKDVLEILDEAIREKNAEVHYEALPAAKLVASQFRQLLQNLLANAIKFSRKDVPPKITIEYAWLPGNEVRHLQPADRYLKLVVSDNGIGFSSEFNTRIFELFKRLHPKSDYEGSGLGLAISKRIVENHGGSIEASSEEGKGTSFTILIPQ